MIAIYARQSVFKPDSISIADQIEKCRDIIAQTETVQVFSDAGYSGKNTARPSFEQILEGVKHGNIQKIVAYRIDRISRSTNDFYELLKLIENYSVEFQTVADGLHYKKGDFISKMIMQFLMAFAEFERQTIQSRVAENYFARASAGLYLGGYAPFGYKKVGKGSASHLEIDEEKADIIRKIFTQYADPNLNISIGKLSRQLNKQGIATARNDFWTTSTLGRILHSPVYVQANENVYAYLKDRCKSIHNSRKDFAGNTKGFYIYAKQIERSEEEQKRYKKKIAGRTAANLKNAEIVLALHEGIVPPDIWIAVQEKLSNNKQLKCDRSGTHSWLSGVMKCGYCNTGLYVVNNNRGRYYVNCYGRKKGICTVKKGGIRLEDIEHEVENVIFIVLQHLSSVKAIKLKNENQEIKKLKLEHSKLKEEIKEIHDTILELIRQKKSNAATAIASNYETAIEMLNKLDEEISAEQFKTASKLAPAFSADMVRNAWSTYDTEQKRIVARALLHKIVVTANPNKAENGSSAFVDVIVNAAL